MIRAADREPLAAKVPEIGVLFWVIKILTTGMGEAASDYLGNSNLLLAGVIGVGGFGVALWLQFRVRRYLAAVYWLAVMMVAVFGTMVADGLHVALNLPYPVTTATYALAVAVIFAVWHRSEGTLDIHSITSRRREAFYWVTVLATFALGTAAGDLTANAMQLGYFSSTVVFAALIALPALAYSRLHLSPVLAFWFAYVLTRPLGASLADWLAKPHAKGGGLGAGDGTVAGIALIAIVALVGYAAVSRRDIQPDTGLRHFDEQNPSSVSQWS
jgi:uncharacterized membrane-anchored protein